MVTHYSTNGLEAACGRTAQTLVSSGVSDEVSCKSCQRTLLKPAPVSVAKSPSLAELRKQAKAAAAPAGTVGVPAVRASAPARAPLVDAGVPTAAPVERAAGFSVKASWAAKLAAEGAGNRAPRGTLRTTRA
ncbi:hypothetical protein SJI00_18235 [Pseudomonas sp. RP23018S]|uniref:hypothetical protein n=1 Tax=Pseudomonas sp. RP23018S TaxID=3096037 RepID=UPI002ACA999B|nr:hypothetical protein [Pseudomonas sp. RP23018S]MDZ5604711.1 hypothetical protein [Pseudomonas sp. RP23018S]